MDELKVRKRKSKPSGVLQIELPENAQLYQELQKEIAERKQAAAGLKKSRDELEARVLERTADLREINESLNYEIEKRKEAEESLREKLAYISKKNRYESVIGAVTRSVHKSIDLQEVLENAAEAMCRNIEGVDNIAISLVEGDEAVLKAYRGYPGWFIERIRKIAYPKDATWKAISDKKPIYCPDVDRDTVIGPAGREVGTKSYMTMPIFWKDEVEGVININSLKKNAFDEDDLSLLEIVARQIEAAVNNAKQADVIEQSRDYYLKLLEEFPNPVWRSGVDAKRDYFNKGWLNFTGRTIEQEAGDGWAEGVHPEDLERCVKIYVDSFHARRPFEREYRLHHHTGEYRWIVDFGMPLYDLHGNFTGYIGSCYDIAGRKWAEDTLRENFAQLTVKNRNEAIISAITQSVHQSIDLQKVLENAADSISGYMDNAENIAIYVVEGLDAVLKTHRGHPDWFIQRVGRIPYPKGFTWKTIISGKASYCPDTDEEGAIGPAGRELGIKSYLSVPICCFGDSTVGCININSLRKDAFAEEDLNLFKIVVGQIEIAINNARQAEELQKAKEGLEIRVEERTKELAEINEELKKEIAERKDAEEQIKASLTEKEVLLKEIHHRVKNNLQIISSLLNLQSKYVTGRNAAEKFKESQNRVKSMALIHEKLYQSKNLAEINLADYIKNLSSHLVRFYASDKVKLKLDLGDVLMNIDKAIPCGLIVNELVSNSLKHAFSEGDQGEIRVELGSDGNNYVLRVGNDGAPFPKNVDFRNTKSLGLQLVCALVEQLKGAIELDTASGTEFRVTFSGGGIKMHDT